MPKTCPNPPVEGVDNLTYNLSDIRVQANDIIWRHWNRANVVLQYPDVTQPSGKCQVLAFDVTSLGEFYVQLEKKGVANQEVELRCTIYELYSSLSEAEMIFKDPEVGMPCCQGGVWLVQSRRL